MRSEIEAAHREQAQGARLRARIQWAEEGEAPSAYFFRLEKKRARQRVISSIRNLAGVIVSTTKAIALAWLQFYTLLFTAQALNMEHRRFFLDVCQYADDTTIVVVSPGALEAVFALFRRYELASGAKLNATKSHGLLFGSWRHLENLPVKLQWSSDSICVLGSRLANEASEDWASKVEALSSIFSAWRPRHLSYHGRALIANTCGLSILWYLASFSCLPAGVIKQINSAVFSFIWQRKSEWLARSSVTQRPALGGLGVVDIPRKVKSLHVLWIKRLTLHPDLPWTSFFRMYLRRAFPGRSTLQIFSLPSPPVYAMQALPPFYRSVMEAWFSLSRERVNDEFVISGGQNASCQLSSLSAKFVYDALSAQARTRHRCVERYRGWGLQCEWPNVWRSLILWRFNRNVRNTSWLIAHGILPTADRLIRFGMRVDPLCHCGKEETLIHLFTACPLVLQLMRWYHSILRRFSPSAPFPSPSQMLVGYASSVRLPPVFPCLLGIIRHYTWVARNAYTVDRTRPNFATSRDWIKSSLRFQLKIQRRHCMPRQFVDHWLAGGVFGAVTSRDTPEFHAILK